MNNIKSRMLTAIAALISLVASITPIQVNAQIINDVIASTISQMSVAEQKCKAGEPASPGNVANARANADQLLSAYFKLTSISKSGEIKRVFAMNTKDVSWRDADGAVPVSELGKRLNGSTPTLTAVAFVVAGDAESARGIWLASSNEDGAKQLSYAVDFIAEHSFLTGRKWRIWHMSVQPAEIAPPTPAAYCHFDPKQAF